MVYYIDIFTNGEKDYLWDGRARFLPRVGDTIKFNNKYKVVEVVFHWFTKKRNSIDVTIYVEKET